MKAADNISELEKLNNNVHEMQNLRAENKLLTVKNVSKKH
jgi:hypothetical protein